MTPELRPSSEFTGSEVKASACNAGDLGWIPRLGRSSGEGNGNPLQYSCLENPMDRGTWWATVHGSQSRTQLSDFTFTFTFKVRKTHLQRKQPHVSKVGSLGKEQLGQVTPQPHLKSFQAPRFWAWALTLSPEPCWLPAITGCSVFEGKIHLKNWRMKSPPAASSSPPTMPPMRSTRAT